MQKTKANFKFGNRQFDFILCIIVFLLLAMGVIMVLSASAPSALATTGNSYTYVSKQLLFAIVGIVAMFFLSKVDYRIYKKYYWIIYFGSIIVSLFVLVPGLGVSVKGATRWIQIGGQRFQPSEITKIGMIVFYAGYLSDHKNQLGDFVQGFLKPLAFLIPPGLVLFFVQNHLSVFIVIVIVTLVMMFIAGGRAKHFLIVGIVGVSLVFGVIGISQLSGSNNFRLERISTFFHPWDDAQGSGYQMVQSLYAIGSGGTFGLGLGNSKQKYLYIPEPHNDFIFSILAEEMGFFGCLIVIALFLLFVWRGVLVSTKAIDMFGSLLSIGITTMITFQTILNIAVVTATIPTTGMSLPFFSYGGTALLILLALVGILLNISRSNSKV